MVSPLVTVTGDGGDGGGASWHPQTHKKRRARRGASPRSDKAPAAIPRDADAVTRRGLTRTKASERRRATSPTADRRAFFAAATGLFSPTVRAQRAIALNPLDPVATRAAPGAVPSSFCHTACRDHPVTSTCIRPLGTPFFFFASSARRPRRSPPSPSISAQSRRELRRASNPARTRVPPRRRGRSRSQRWSLGSIWATGCSRDAGAAGSAACTTPPRPTTRTPR